MPSEFFTPPEVARLLRVRESKVATWIKTGRLSAVNLSDSRRPRYRVSRAALDAFLANQAVAPAAPTARRQRREVTPQYV